MKNLILIRLLAIVIIGGTMANCQSQATKEDKTNDKVQDAENNLTEAQDKLLNAQQDSTTTYQKFITESENRISSYETSMIKIFKHTRG